MSTHTNLRPEAPSTLYCGLAGVVGISLGALLLQACSKPIEPVAPVTKPVAAATVAWVKPEGANIDAIFDAAKTGNKPVFLYWGAVWCPPCNQVKATVFNRKDFIDRSQQVIAVYLDGDTPGAQKLGAQFKVRGYPTMILLRPDRSELTRLPGEVDAQRYLEVLDLAVTSGISVREALAAALSNDKSRATPQAWHQLAYYAWDQDEAQLVPTKERTATLHKLAMAAPAQPAGVAARLALKAVVSSSQDKTPLPEPAHWLQRVMQILGDAALARESFDVLVNYSAEVASTLTAAGTTQRAALVSQLNLALDRLGADPSLAPSDRLSAVYAKVALAKLNVSENASFVPDPALISLARDAANTVNNSVTGNYERQAAIPAAAELLSEVGLFDASDALLKAELPKAVSAYYHMLVLSGNAKLRGDKAESINWSERAWNESRGPATRLQWGVGYVNRIIDLAPQDATRVEKAASGVLADLEPVPETFYERNRRGLEKLGAKLYAWNAKAEHTDVVQRLTKQLEAVCAKLPEADEAHAACSGAFKPKSKN